MANLNWCRTCGKEYPVCPHCEQDARLRNGIIAGR